MLLLKTWRRNAPTYKVISLKDSVTLTQDVGVKLKVKDENTRRLYIEHRNKLQYIKRANFYFFNIIVAKLYLPR